jgi:hypothetical protein
MGVSIEFCYTTDEDGYSFWHAFGFDFLDFCEKENILVQIAVWGCSMILHSQRCFECRLEFVCTGHASGWICDSQVDESAVEAGM